MFALCEDVHEWLLQDGWKQCIPCGHIEYDEGFLTRKAKRKSN